MHFYSSTITITETTTDAIIPQGQIQIERP